MPQRKYGARRSTYRRRPVRRAMGTTTARIYRKKRFAKYRIAGNSGVGRGYSPAVFPQRLFKTFEYNGGSQKLSQTIGDVPASYSFRGNSLFDPDYTGVGSQPRWVDTFLGASGGSQPYNRYTVLASKIVISIWQDPVLTGTNGSTAGIVAVMPLVGMPGSIPDTLKEMQERAFIRWKNVGNANSHKPLVLKHFCKTKALWQGVNPLTNGDFTSLYNNNPTNQFSWAIMACNVISAAGINLFSCYLSVRIKYYCMLSTLNDVANS